MNNLMRSEWLEQLPDYLAEIMQQMSLEATAIIAARINYIGKVKKSDIHKLTNALAFAGADITEIERVIARFTKKSEAEIERILTEVAAEDDSFAKLYYEMKGITPKTYITDAYLQTALNSVIKQTQEAIRNLSNTTSLFYQMPDGTYSDIRSTYIRVIDQAIYEVQSGSIDYHTAMKRAMLSLGKGTRCIEYMSGYHRRLDSAVRQNILDGAKQLNQAVMDYHGKSFGADGVELTAHAISAPDHVNVQGHRFTNEEFEKMQNGMDCKDIQGRIYNGFPRKITEWNCKHFAIPVIVDIGSPAYTDEQLAEMKKTSAAKYDDTQKARAMETRLRTLKEQKNALLESGDELGAKQVQKKITAQQRVYREFCKQKSIHRDYVRENVPKAKEVKLTDGQQSAINSYISSDGYMLNYKLRNDIPLTEQEKQFRINLDSALSKMPKYKGTLTRSVYFDDDAELQDFLNAHTVGSTVKYKGYTSTTYGERYNDTSKVEMLIMNANKGRDISFFNPNEKEVLYERNSEFYIEKASKASNGTYYIILREI